MKAIEITSPDNQKLKLTRSLAQGKNADKNLILLEGQNLIVEALDKQIELISVIVSETFYKNSFSDNKLTAHLDSVIIVKDSLFKDLYTTDTSCGIVAVAVPKIYSLTDIISSGKTLLLGDHIQDPGNVGTIIRTAFAFESGGLVLSKGSADCHSPKVIRSSMGAIFSMPVLQNIELSLLINELKENNFSIIALDANAKKDIQQTLSINKNKAYILGNEGHGIAPDILRQANFTVSIPINPACESLNVAIAAGIILAFDKYQEGKQS